MLNCLNAGSLVINYKEVFKMDKNGLRCSDKAFIHCCYAAAAVILTAIGGISYCVKTIFDYMIVKED